MLNTQIAKKALDDLDAFRIKDQEKALEVLSNFINSVEELMTKNCIKQTPAIFCPYGTVNS